MLSAGLHLKGVRNGAHCISLPSILCICCIMRFYISLLICNCIFVFIVLLYFLFCTLCNGSDSFNGAPCISEPSTPPSLSERPVTVLRVQANKIATCIFWICPGEIL